MKCLTDIEVIGGQVHHVPKLSLQNPLGFEKIVERLQDIENILGDDYDLDRSAWEPCEYCESKCQMCLRNKTSRCEKCNNYDCYYPVSNFCKHCGRPLNDAAWEMLERRLSGREN